MRRRELSVPQLLRWADAHFDREGAWPNVDSGRVYEATDEKWPNIDGNLRRGDRGLPGGWSLAQMLDEFRGLRNRAALPPHSVELILGWADVHHERTGQWPVFGSGPIPNASGESWAAVNACLVLGGRGMPCGSSLAQLLKRERSVPSNAGRKKALGSGPNAGAWSRVAAKRRMEARAAASREQIELCREGRNIQALPPFTLDQILGWADSYHLRHGAWPKRYAGLIEGTAGETWVAVNIALSRGLRGLRAGSSLAQLLAERRGVHPGRFRRFTEQEVLALADAHHERSGTWPTVLSGPIPELTDVTWAVIDKAFKAGTHGLPGGSSLARFLDRHRGTRKSHSYAKLDIELILAWADAYHARRGRWPNINSGAVDGSPTDTWNGINSALRNGARGMSAGSSLAQLLAERRGVRNHAALPTLTEFQILAWADAFHARYGTWPTQKSGTIDDAPCESWGAIDQSLHDGRRDLPGGESLPGLLARFGKGHTRRRKGLLTRRRLNRTIR